MLWWVEINIYLFAYLGKLPRLNFVFSGAGVECSVYHAGLGPKQRKKAHEDFVKDKVSATINIFCYLLK
jgi:superfamily II helicase